MKKNQIIILSVILGALLLGVFLKGWVRSGGDNAGAVRRASVTFAEFEPAKLEKILIDRPAKKDHPWPAVELVKENGIWKVKSLWNVKADPAKVEKLIEKLRSGQGELRGSGKKLFRDFGIQDANAFSIKLLGPGDALLQDLRMGTKQAGENAYFIREATSEDVYLIDMNREELLGIYADFEEAAPSSLFWADLSPFHLDPEKVTKITVYLLRGQEKTMALGLERQPDPKDPLKSSWKFLRKGMSSEPDPDKVLRFISMMNNARAQKVVDPNGKGYGLEKPVWQLGVTEASKKTLLNAGPKDEKGGFVYVGYVKDPAVFNLPISFFEDLNVDDTYFIKGASLVLGAKKVSPQGMSAAMMEEQEQVA